MHWARLATQGANSIQLTYSYLGPIVSDFDEIKGNFGQFGGVFFICELRKAAECAENCQIEKRCCNKMTAVSQLNSKTRLLESVINLVLDRNFVHCSPISPWTVKTKDRKCRRLQNARMHSK